MTWPLSLSLIPPAALCAHGQSFDPLTLNPSLLRDASNLATLWKDTPGVTPVAADQDVVARIDDLSGNNNAFTQASASLRPKWRTAGGKSWLEYDGVDDRLTGPALSAILGTGSSHYEYLAAVRFISGPSSILAVGQCPAVFADDPAQGYSQLGYITAAPRKIGQMAYDASTKSVEASGYTIGDDVVFAATFDGSNIGIALNGGAAATAASVGPSNRSFTAYLGESRSTWPQIRVYADMAFKRVLTAPERASALAWLASKSGMTL